MTILFCKMRSNMRSLLEHEDKTFPMFENQGWEELRTFLFRPSRAPNLTYHMRTSSYILHLPTLKGFDFVCVCLFLKNLEIFRKCKQQETKPLLILPRDKTLHAELSRLSWFPSSLFYVLVTKKKKTKNCTVSTLYAFCILFPYLKHFSQVITFFWMLGKC